MGLSLADLRAAMAPLAQVGKGELSFDVMGTNITLRALTPDEEIEVQRYARSVIAEGDLTDQVGALEYLDRFRIASLGYSIVQIGNLDFRNAEMIETGEKLPNGVAVKVKRHEAIQGLVASWSRNMVVAVFKKFGELMNKVEKEVEDLIAFDPVDYDAEITRLEERIRELKEEKIRMSASETDARTNLRNQVASAANPSVRHPLGKPALPEETSDPIRDQMKSPQEAATVAVPPDEERVVVSEDEPDESFDEPEESFEEPEGAPEPAVARTPVFARGQGQVPPPPSAPSPPPNEPGEPAEGEDGPVPEDFGMESSMLDMNDPDATEKAIEAENRRLLEMRRNAAAARRIPPHLAAKSIADAVPEPKKIAPESVLTPKTVAGEPLAKSMAASPAGTKDGVEVYRMPTQVLSDRGRGSPPPAKAPPKSNLNPRFKPTTKG